MHQIFSGTFIFPEDYLHETRYCARQLQIAQDL